MKELIKSYLEKIDLSKTLVLLTICVSFLFTNYALVFVEIPERNAAIFHAFVGIIEVSFAGAVINWYFGSSKGSMKKTELIDKMVDKSAGGTLS